MRSASVDLPWSMWAMMQKFRMTDGSVDPGLGALALATAVWSSSGGRACGGCWMRPRAWARSCGTIVRPASPDRRRERPAAAALWPATGPRASRPGDAAAAPGWSGFGPGTPLPGTLACRAARCPHACPTPDHQSASRTDDAKATGTPVANIKSQIKRNRTNEAARLRNKSVKSALKTSVRKFREAADAGDAAAAAELAKTATRQLDKAASKGVIHKNQAANRKSAIASRAAELQKTA